MIVEARRHGALITNLYCRDRLLAVTGWVNWALLVAMLAIAPFDVRIVMGLNPWIKPMKFAVSFAVFVWTMAWFRPYLGGRPASRRVSLTIAIAVLGEIACIALQAGRGTTSHYNTTTPFNFAVFAAMATFIFLNTGAVAVALVLMRRPAQPLAPGYAWGIRLGLLLIIAGSLEGLLMIFRTSHTVGLPDGGAGLFFVNWSTRAGDLRVAHFLGMHSLQLLPAFGYLLSRWAPTVPARQQVITVALVAAAYASVIGWALARALEGAPLWQL